MTAMDIISGDRIVTGGRDTSETSKSRSTIEVTIRFHFLSFNILQDGAGNLIIGCSNGDIFRYNMTDWSREESSISSGQNIISISFTEDGDILVVSKTVSCTNLPVLLLKKPFILPLVE